MPTVRHLCEPWRLLEEIWYLLKSNIFYLLWPILSLEFKHEIDSNFRSNGPSCKSSGPAQFKYYFSKSLIYTKTETQT